MRADIWLHNVRIFKTRSIATQACNRGNVSIDGQTIKPARALKPGDTLDVTRGELKLVVKVIDFPEKRVGAPLVPLHLENLTPQENFIKAAEARRMMAMTAPHEAAARPNKRELRKIREWLGQE
jgi:ribosome-associated heat shock protein Hsp15